LRDEGGSEEYKYKTVSKWSQKILGVHGSPLDYNVIMFMRNANKHWWAYVMFPKAQHIEGIDSMGSNDLFSIDIQSLWRWLNDDIRFHWGL
jgi:hypothetical protein